MREGDGTPSSNIRTAASPVATPKCGPVYSGDTSSETSVLNRATRRNIPEDGVLHSHRRENLESYMALTGWALLWRRNVSPVKYELGFYIPEDDILHSHRLDNLKSYIALTGWTV
jgi:hypothetical protein